MSGTEIERPIKVVHGFSASGCTVVKFQNCRSFITISVTPWSRTQACSAEIRTGSRPVNMLSGTDFFIVVLLICGLCFVYSAPNLAGSVSQWAHIPPGRRKSRASCIGLSLRSCDDRHHADASWRIDLHSIGTLVRKSELVGLVILQSAHTYVT